MAFRAKENLSCLERDLRPKFLFWAFICIHISAAPKLSEVTEKDIESFTSHSVPISTKARADHIEELRLLKQPWWRKLGDEYQDRKLEEETAPWKVF